MKRPVTRKKVLYWAIVLIGPVIFVTITALNLLNRDAQPVNSTGPIASRGELMRQGILSPIGNKPSGPIPAEASPELSKEAKESLKKDRLLKEAQDELKRLQGNPYDPMDTNGGVDMG